MPTQFDAAGFEDLRQYVQNNWDHIALLDTGGTEHLRIDVPNDSRASFSSDYTSNPVTATITITGQDLIDAGATLPVTLDTTETYKTDAATSRTSHDTHTDATLEASSDEVTITHDYEQPPI